jgi:uncharacterized membrane protein YadS
MNPRAPKFSEDWLVTFLGLFLVTLPLWLLPLPTPGYKLAELLASTHSVSLLVGQGVVACGIWMVIAIATGRPWRASLASFACVWSVGQGALLLAGASWAKSLGLEAVIFSLLIGLVLGQVLRVPASWRHVMSSELWVKLGLVMLGASVIFSDLLKAGGLGLLQASVVVIVVWYAAFFIAGYFKLDEELKLMIASAVSICGVSAAIATAGAIQGDSKKLSTVVSMVLIVAIPMMLGMPYLASYLGLSDAVTGAWLGGTIDTTGAVVAAGSLAGEEALKMSTIVKFSQNVLLGIAAFAISLYWAYRKTSEARERPSLQVIWQRFPKFVIGFIVASLVFTFLVTPGALAGAKEGIKSMQMLWFVMAFVAIGLETNLRDLFQQQNRKALYTFLLAQGVNILLTLGISLLLFS